VDAILDRLAQQGQVTRAGQSKRGWSWSPRALGLPSGTVARLLDDLQHDK
jgi:hypothetical protein